MFAFFVCTGNKAVYFVWLHRNNKYNTVTTVQNCGAQR